MLALLVSLTSAHALTSHQSGPSLDLAAGLGLRGAPVRPALGGELSAGWWLGVYDDQYAFGKYWWLGATALADWRPEAVGLAPMVEIRRGLELFVVGISPFVAAGPALVVSDAAPPVGFTARAGAMVKLRRTRFLGVSLRLEAGADVLGGEPSFAGAALFGVSWARPIQPIRAPEL